MSECWSNSLKIKLIWTEKISSKERDQFCKGGLVIFSPKNQQLYNSTSANRHQENFPHTTNRQEWPSTAQPQRLLFSQNFFFLVYTNGLLQTSRASGLLLTFLMIYYCHYLIVFPIFFFFVNALCKTDKFSWVILAFCDTPFRFLRFKYKWHIIIFWK